MAIDDEYPEIREDAYEKYSSAQFDWMSWEDAWASVSAKLAQAHEHFWTLHWEVWNYLKTSPPAMQIKPAPKIGQDWYALTMHPQSPERRIPLVLGDLLHNARSAIDHTLTAIDHRAGRRASFPICTTERAFMEWEEDWVDNRGSIELTHTLREMQPYRTAAYGDVNPEHHWLRIIAKLNNEDKHRILNVAPLAMRDAEHYGLRLSCSVPVQEIKWFELPKGHPLPPDEFPMLALRIDDYSDLTNVGIEGPPPFTISLDGFENIIEIAWISLTQSAKLCGRLRALHA